MARTLSFRQDLEGWFFFRPKKTTLEKSQGCHLAFWENGLHLFSIFSCVDNLCFIFWKKSIFLHIYFGSFYYFTNVSFCKLFWTNMAIKILIIWQPWNISHLAKSKKKHGMGKRKWEREKKNATKKFVFNNLN